MAGRGSHRTCQQHCSTCVWSCRQSGHRRNQSGRPIILSLKVLPEYLSQFPPFLGK
jgi:hypothetical protein